MIQMFFWKFVKCKRRSNSDIPSTMSWNNRTANSGIEVSNLFASFFESVYIHDTHQRPSLAEPQRVLFPTLNEFEVSIEVVYKTQLSLNTKKGAGPDGLPNSFLKNCAISLSEHLTHIFSASLQSGTFPTYWKLSYVCPIHKDGPRSDVSNYRPICIQSALAKLFEKTGSPPAHCIHYEYNHQ